jgi:hypothetical protein
MKVRKSPASSPPAPRWAMEENLITEVQKYPHLYDLKNEAYKDKIMKEKTWRNITEVVGFPDGGN